MEVLVSGPADVAEDLGPRGGGLQLRLKPLLGGRLGPTLLPLPPQRPRLVRDGGFRHRCDERFGLLTCRFCGRVLEDPGLFLVSDHEPSGQLGRLRRAVGRLPGRLARRPQGGLVEGAGGGVEQNFTHGLEHRVSIRQRVPVRLQHRAAVVPHVLVHGLQPAFPQRPRQALPHHAHAARSSPHVPVRHGLQPPPLPPPSAHSPRGGEGPRGDF